SLPSTLPPEWQCVEHILRSPDQLIWMAEYNSACIAALKKSIGVPDRFIKPSKVLLRFLQNQGVDPLDFIKKGDRYPLHRHPLLSHCIFVSNDGILLIIYICSHRN